MPLFIIPNSDGTEIRERWSDAARQAAAAARKGGNIPTDKFDNLLRKGVSGVNLSKVSVGGRKIFSSRFKNLRSQMPQLSGDLRKQFLSSLKDHGVGVEKVKVPAASLRPSQRQFSFSRASQLFRKSSGKGKRILVSQDNQIIDGHHHWVSAIGRDARNGRLGGTKMRAYRINMRASRLLHLAKRWAAAHGAPSKGV